MTADEIRRIAVEIERETALLGDPATRHGARQALNRLVRELFHLADFVETELPQ